MKIKNKVAVQFTCKCQQVLAWIHEGQTLSPCPICGRRYKGVYDDRIFTLNAVEVVDPVAKKPQQDSLFSHKGRFFISQSVLISDNEEMLQELFKNFVIVRAEHLLMTDMTEFYAYSRLFDTAVLSEAVPDYYISCSVIVVDGEKPQYEFKAERMEAQCS